MYTNEAVELRDNSSKVGHTYDKHPESLLKAANKEILLGYDDVIYTTPPLANPELARGRQEAYRHAYAQQLYLDESANKICKTPEMCSSVHIDIVPIVQGNEDEANNNTSKQKFIYRT